MIIDLIDEANYLSQTQGELIQSIVKATANYLGLHGETEVDISIVSNEEIHTLNREYRQIDRPTDVLSFALSEVSSEFDIDFDTLNYADVTETDEDLLLNESNEAVVLPEHLGDIIISYPRAVEQANEYGHSIERELAFLTVHGFLHLNGYDHQTDDEAKRMFGIQEEVLNQYGLTR